MAGGKDGGQQWPQIHVLMKVGQDTYLWAWNTLLTVAFHLSHSN